MGEALTATFKTEINGNITGWKEMEVDFNKNYIERTLSHMVPL